MGLLDHVVGAALGGSRGGGPLLDLAMSLIGSNGQGLNHLLGQFASAGLGDVARSWVSTGQNLPVSPDQLVRALGTTQIQDLARQFGIAPDAVAGQLSQLLPQVVDRLTPQGQVPADLPDIGPLDDIVRNFLR